MVTREQVAIRPQVRLSKARFKEIKRAVDSGMRFKEVAKVYGIAPSTAHSHYRKATGAWSEEDFNLIRKLAATYGLDGVAKEVARMAANYANVSDKWKRVAMHLRLLIARELS